MRMRARGSYTKDLCVSQLEEENLPATDDVTLFLMAKSPATITMS